MYEHVFSSNMAKTKNLKEYTKVKKKLIRI